MQAVSARARALLKAWLSPWVPLELDVEVRLPPDTVSLAIVPTRERQDERDPVRVVRNFAGETDEPSRMRSPIVGAAASVLAASLAPGLRVEINYRIESAPQLVPLFVARGTAAEPADDALGHLARMIRRPVLLETELLDKPSLSIDERDIRRIVLRRLTFGRWLRRARGASKSRSRKAPEAWVFCHATPPRDVMRAFGFQRFVGWPEGVYTMAPGFGLHLVSLAELGRDVETLALRLLGKGSVRHKARSDVEALPEGHPMRTTLEGGCASDGLAAARVVGSSEKGRELRGSCTRRSSSPRRCSSR